ncbi:MULTISPECIES: hypothetical protein [unclassified Mesorhizobium]|uniref:hypothetical protein n=1 Tax=unclassified Mesorhizobium TaxID=325217 RepID=UPI000F761482|nr:MULTISPECIES: hypothetical protein [unclassified Mesorhizobium]AZO28594.1 hypothetical protein EJ071_15165 [Mesorhizobium sp. M1B.F.Ca.ET.045.04.1.1]RWA69288.1 MAG: hypothetical protein EOQ29_17030 [Mesorhizobium sp.]RWA84438.1 MAG: hypothetical protein EOQ30_08960 [Mesorhizobium sp.]RWE01560.1 MAG: hypothetical protein EOS40_10970 [Mesorhizobium sp.]TIS49836.1 MAG: hypothetical protein E5W96_10655 [Mesorhizobium sp.]
MDAVTPAANRADNDKIPARPQDGPNQPHGAEHGIKAGNMRRCHEDKQNEKLQPGGVHEKENLELKEDCGRDGCNRR